MKNGKPRAGHAARHAHAPTTSLVGRENAYRCSTCRGYTTTIDIDEGVTPMFLNCRATPGCEGTAASLMYPRGARPPHIPAPAWEWYRPEDAAPLTPAERGHVEMGGLLLRPRSVPQ